MLPDVTDPDGVATVPGVPLLGAGGLATVATQAVPPEGKATHELFGTALGQTSSPLNVPHVAPFAPDTSHASVPLLFTQAGTLLAVPPVGAGIPPETPGVVAAVAPQDSPVAYASAMY